jgi:hypothetical protein
MRSLAATPDDVADDGTVTVGASMLDWISLNSFGLPVSKVQFAVADA